MLLSHCLFHLKLQFGPECKSVLEQYGLNVSSRRCDYTDVMLQGVCEKKGEDAASPESALICDFLLPWQQEQVAVG